jgi:hypothetical protein
MHNAESILVIIVSSFLTLFLIVTIVLILLLIKLVKQLRIIADKAEKAVESVEHAGEIFKNTAGPLGAMKFMRNVYKQFNKNK